MDKSELLLNELEELKRRVALMDTRLMALETAIYGSSGGVQYGKPIYEVLPETIIEANSPTTTREWLAATHQDNEQPKSLPTGKDAIRRLMEESIRAGWEDWDRKWDAEAAKVQTNRADPLTFTIDGQLLAWVNLDGTIGGDPTALLSKAYGLPMKGNIATFVAAARLMVSALRADPTLHSNRYRPTNR